MKKTLLGLAAALVVAGASTFFIGASNPQDAAPAPAPKAAVQKWEYKVVDKQDMKPVKLFPPSSLAEDSAKYTNDLGAEGWELVAVLPKPDPAGGGKPNPYVLYFFKRPLN